MRKIISIFVLTLVVFLFSAQFAQAALVPCGRSADDLYTEINEQAPCTFSHFFVLFDNVLRFLIYPPTGIIFLVAVLFIIFGGVMYIINRGEGKIFGIADSRAIITSAAVGLAIILVSWVAINTFFSFLDVAEWTGLKGGWWKVPGDAVDKKPTCLGGTCEKKGLRSDSSAYWQCRYKDYKNNNFAGNCLP